MTRTKATRIAGVAGRPRLRISWQASAITVLLLVAAALRISAAAQSNFWLDEFWTLELSCGHGTAHEHLPVNQWLAEPTCLTSLADAKPSWTTWTSLDEVTHPPIYFLLLRFWRVVTGGGDVATKLLPCVASIAAVPLMYRVVRDLHGSRPAIWASLLLALAGSQVYFAQEVRSYSLIVALGLTAIALLVAIERRGASWGKVTGFGVVSLSLVLTHYFTLGAVLGLAVYAMLRLPRRDFMKVLGSLALAATVFVAVWSPFFLSQRNAFSLEAGHGGAAFLADDAPNRLLATVYRLAAVPAELLVGDPDHLPPAWLVWPMLALILMPLYWIRRSPGLLIWYVWIAAVVLPLLVLDLSRSSKHLAIPRYPLLATIGVCGILSAGFEWAGKWGRHLIPAIAAVGCAALLPGTFHSIDEKPDWPGLSSTVLSTVRSKEPILYAGEGGSGGAVYLHAGHYLAATHDHPAVILTTPPSAALIQKLQSSGRCWVVYSGTHEGLERLLPGAKIEVEAFIEGTGVFAEVSWPL